MGFFESADNYLEGITDEIDLDEVRNNLNQEQLQGKEDYARIALWDSLSKLEKMTIVHHARQAREIKLRDAENIEQESTVGRINMAFAKVESDEDDFETERIIEIERERLARGGKEFPRRTADMEELEKRLQEYRKTKWDKLSDEVESITDALGKPVDDGIKQTVVAFRALGFPTSGSCEGHFEYGHPYPWIDIEVPDSREKPKDVEEKEEIEHKRLELEKRLAEYLEGFYQDRKTPYHAILTIQQFPASWFRLRSNGGDISQLPGYGKCNERLKIYKAEMDAFTKYLKAKYLHE